MKQIWNWIKNNPNRAMFLVPILLVAGISISHVVTWYDMANPINWAIYLSIAIEVGAMTALVAATNKIKGGVWFMFGLVTFIQMIGNIFYSYVQIDPNGELFKNWVELTGPVWESMGTDLTDTIGLRRWLAFLEGGLLPLISLTSLHFFVKYEKKEDDNDIDDDIDTTNPPTKPSDDEKPFKVEMSVPEGKEFNTPYPLPEIHEEIIEEGFDEDHALDQVMNNMVEEIMEEEEHETIDELLESLNEDKNGEIEVKPKEVMEESNTEEVVKEIEENSIEEVKEEVKHAPLPNQNVKQITVHNQPPNKKMGIDRIR